MTKSEIYAIKRSYQTFYLHVHTFLWYTEITYTVELQWLKHLMNHANMFETEAGQANECLL